MAHAARAKHVTPAMWTARGEKTPDWVTRVGPARSCVGSGEERMGNRSGRWEISEDCDWEDAVVRENAGRRFEVGRRGVGRGVAHLGVRASHEVARVVHEIGPYLYEEVSDQRAGSLHPPRLAAAGGRQRRPHQEGHRRRGQRLGSRRGDPPGDAALDFGRPRRFRFTPRVRRIAVPSPRRRSRGPALHDVPSPSRLCAHRWRAAHLTAIS